MKLDVTSAASLRWYGAIIGGVLVGLSFWYQPLWWCVLPGMVLVVWALHTEKRTKRAVALAVTAGWIKTGMSVWWLIDAYPADWLGAAPRTHQLVLILFCYVGTTVSIGAGYGIFAYLLQRGNGFKHIFFPLWTGATLLAGELAGALFFSIYSYGPYVPLNTYFGYSMSGYSLADHTLLRYGALAGGSFALTFILGGIAGSVVILVISPSKARRLQGFALLIGIILLGYVPYTVPYHFQNKTVAAIGSKYPSRIYISAAEAASGKRVLEQGVAEALAAHASVVLLPEAAQVAGNGGSNAMLQTLRRMPHDHNAVVVDSYDTVEPDGAAYARGYIYDIDASSTYTTDKRFVVPVGEFMPYFHHSVVSALGGNAFFEGMFLRQGDREIPSDAPPYIPSVLFCFESDSSEIAHIKSNRSLIMHPVSHAWFHTPTTLWNQERQVLIVQSLYTRRPILQAGNMAPSALYIPNGSVESGTVVGADEHHATILFSL